MKLKSIINLHGRIKLKKNQTLISKILRIPDQSENSKNVDLNETTIYNQFQLNEEIKTNQNLYNSPKDQKNQNKSSGT